MEINIDSTQQSFTNMFGQLTNQIQLCNFTEVAKPTCTLSCVPQIILVDIEILAILYPVFSGIEHTHCRYVQVHSNTKNTSLVRILPSPLVFLSMVRQIV